MYFQDILLKLKVKSIELTWVGIAAMAVINSGMVTSWQYRCLNEIEVTCSGRTAKSANFLDSHSVGVRFIFLISRHG